MKKTLYQFIRSKFSVEENKSVSEGENRRIRFVNYIGLIVIANMILYVMLYLFINATLFLPAIVFLSVSSLLTFGIIFLNRAGYNTISKISMSLSVPVFIVSVSSWLFGRSPEFHVFLFAAVIIPLFLWSVKELKFLIFFMILPVSFFIAIEFFSPIFTPIIYLPDNYISYFRSTNLLITFCGPALAVIVYFNLSNKQEKRLQKQAIDIEKSQQHRSLIYSIIAHDLKSPLAILLGMSEVLLQKNENKRDNKEKIIKSIYESSKSLNSLLDNLLEWANMHSGNLAVNSSSFSLKSKIDEVEELLNELYTAKRIRFINKVNNNIYPEADSNMISTILRNIISNSIKFTFEGGEIIIDAKPVNEMIELSIRDTGIGISNEYLEKMFSGETKYITDGTNSEKGSGLGLILCKDFIEANGGRIWAESELNKGSVFYISLRIAQI